MKNWIKYKVRYTICKQSKYSHLIKWYNIWWTNIKQIIKLENLLLLFKLDKCTINTMKYNNTINENNFFNNKTI